MAMVQLLDSVDAISDLAPRLERRPFPARLRAGLGWRLGCVAVDVAMLALTGVATVVGAGAAGVVGVSVGWTIAYCALVFVLLAVRGLYGSSFGLRTADDLRRVAGATGFAAILAARARGRGRRLRERRRPDAPALALRHRVRRRGPRRAQLVAPSRPHRRAKACARRSSSAPAASAASRRRACSTSPRSGLKPIGFLDKDPMADDGAGERCRSSARAGTSSRSCASTTSSR